MTRTRPLIALAAVLAGLNGPLRADTLEMVGGSFVWSETGTWNNRSGPDHPPGPLDVALFDFTTFGYNFFLDVDASCFRVEFNEGSSTWISLGAGSPNQLTVNQSFNVYGDILQLMSLDLDIANDLNVDGDAQMSASGVNLNVGWSLGIGHALPAGAGSLSVGSGSLTVSDNTFVGGAQGDGTLSVSNAPADVGSLYVPASSAPGFSPVGQVNVINGAVVTTDFVFVATAEDSGSSGQILVSGPGTIFDPGVFPVEVGSDIDTTGSIILNDHGVMERPAGSNTTIRRTGAIDISGGAELNLAGTLTIDGGTLTSNGGGLDMIGTDPEIRVETYGLLDISGSFTFGSVSEPPSHPVIVVSGIAEVRIEDHWRMGSTAGSFAHMQLFGVDPIGGSSRLLGTPAASDLLVGDVGSAHLELTGGGLVRDFRDVVIGNLSNASGTLTVTGEGGLGTGSQLRADNTLYIAGGPVPGVESAEGYATISDGGRVIAGTVVLAQSTGCEATLTIGDPPGAGGAAGASFPQPSSLVTSSTVTAGGQGTADLTLWSNGSIDAGGQVKVLPGSSLTMGGGDLGSESDIVIGPSLCSSGDDGGVITGHGTLDVGLEQAVICCGRIRPGGVPDDGAAQPALIDVVGNYTHWGVLEVELTGTIAGIDFGQIAVTGTAMLSGRVEVTLADGYVPTPGCTYDVLVASDTLEDKFVPVQFTLPPDMIGQVLPDRITITALAPCAADLDGDGTVGITDFLDLLAAWGPNPGHPADFDGDGMVGINDFLELLANWGPC